MRGTTRFTIETFAADICIEGLISNDRRWRKNRTIDQPWPIIPAQATEAVRRIDRSIDGAFPFRSSISTNSKASSISVESVPIDSFTISRGTRREFVKKNPLFSSEKKERTLLEEGGREGEKDRRRETLRADYTVGQCEKYYPLISLRTPCRFHSAPRN